MSFASRAELTERLQGFFQGSPTEEAGSTTEGPTDTGADEGAAPAPAEAASSQPPVGEEAPPPAADASTVAAPAAVASTEHDYLKEYIQAGEDRARRIEEAQAELLRALTPAEVAAVGAAPQSTDSADPLVESLLSALDAEDPGDAAIISMMRDLAARTQKSEAFNTQLEDALLERQATLRFDAEATRIKALYPEVPETVLHLAVASAPDDATDALSFMEPVALHVATAIRAIVAEKDKEIAALKAAGGAPKPAASVSAPKVKPAVAPRAQPAPGAAAATTDDVDYTSARERKRALAEKLAPLFHMS